MCRLKPNQRFLGLYIEGTVYIIPEGEARRDYVPEALRTEGAVSNQLRDKIRNGKPGFEAKKMCNVT